MTVFHAVHRPNISIRDYLARIQKYAGCTTESFVLCLVYIDRIIQKNKNYAISSLNVHRLLITAVMLAAKFSEDTYYNNAYYAKIGGVPCEELNKLELEFLFLVNFSLNVTAEVFEKYRLELVRHTVSVLRHERAGSAADVAR